MEITIYTDGASRGNPGQSSYGFVIYDENKKLLYEEGKYLGIQTNNFAEYSAVLSALVYASKNYPKNTIINFFMDSKLVKEQLSGRYKIKSQNLIPLIQRIRLLEMEFSKVNYTHIPRALNKEADRLGNMALDSLK